MATLSFISASAASDFVAAPQDLSFVTGVVYEQFGQYKVDVVFDGLTTAEQFDDKIYPLGGVMRRFTEDGRPLPLGA